MMRFTKMSALVLATLILCSGVSLAASKGGSSSGRGSGGSSGNMSRGTSNSKGSNSMILPRSTTTKVVPTKVDKVITTRVINVQVITTRVTPGKTTDVVPGKVSMVIPTIVTQVVVTKCHNPKVICCVIGCFGVFDYMFGAAMPVQYERYLRLTNDTGEKLTVYLRYHTEDITGQWDWIPEAPGPQANKWLAFQLQPGEILEPRFQDIPIAANKIRLYAESASRSWTNYMEEDFWLVPEVTPEGVHLYYSEYRQTFDFHINSGK